MPQGRTDAVHGARPDRPPVPHLGPLVRIVAGAGGDDDIVELLDRVEHARDVRDPQPVQPDVTQVGSEVQPDVRLIGAARGLIDLPLAAQELGHPLRDRHGRVQILMGTDLAPHLLHRREHFGVLEDGQHQVGDLPPDMRILIQRQQRAGVLQLRLHLLHRSEALAAQRVAPPPVRVRGQLLLVSPRAVRGTPPLPLPSRAA
nr:hypothetical protein [Nonomuraea sp. SYSU D8015]